MGQSLEQRGAVVRDSIRISKPAAEVFEALSDARALVKWWPKEAQSEPRKGGRLVLHWGRGKDIVTAFDTFEPGTRLSYVFGPEEVVDFTLEGEGSETKVTVTHSRISTKAGYDQIVHIAQSWAFLLCNLKTSLERGWDLRPPAEMKAAG